jgi:hypothetical protein
VAVCGRRGAALEAVGREGWLQQQGGAGVDGGRAGGAFGGRLGGGGRGQLVVGRRVVHGGERLAQVEDLGVRLVVVSGALQQVLRHVVRRVRILHAEARRAHVRAGDARRRARRRRAARVARRRRRPPPPVVVSHAQAHAAHRQAAAAVARAHGRVGRQGSLTSRGGASTATVATNY